MDQLTAVSDSDALARERDYFDRQRHRLRYADFKKEHIPRGSGAIESLIRRVITLRLKGNSEYWKEENAERMLHMRAQLKVDRWEKMVRRVLRYARGFMEE